VGGTIGGGVGRELGETTLKRLIAAAAAAIFLSQASLAAAASIIIPLDAPAPGYANTYLVTGGDGPIERVVAVADYNWWWTVPIYAPGPTGYYELYYMEGVFGVSCSGASCARSDYYNEERGFTVAMTSTDAGRFVRVSNRMTQKFFDECSTDAPSPFPCRLDFQPPRFYLTVGDSWGTGEGFIVELLETTAVPEPATWAMMIIGFGLVGAASRYCRRAAWSPLARAV